MTTTKEELIRIKNNAVGKDGVQISTLMLHCICDMARDSLDWQTENARLKAALDKYSEDEMLLIEQCAVAALKSIDLHSWDRDTQKLAAETIAKIEKGTTK